MLSAGKNVPTAPNPGALRWENARGTPGFFRVAPDEAGHWWLADADDRAFFCKAVHGVRAGTAGAGEVADAPDAAGVSIETAAVRLRRWGFNAVGADSDDSGQADGLAFFANADFCRAGVTIVAPGTRLPDVFAPDWPRLAAEHALAVCAPLALERALIGWMPDMALAWAQPDAATALRAGPDALPDAGAARVRPTLLQLCLSLEPSFAAYHAAWEFVLALHGGKLPALARAWGTPLTNKEVVRELTRAESGLATRGYLRDLVRWTREFARRYFTGAAAAIRAADPHHLVLGARSVGAAGEAVRAECVYPAIDVPLIDWNELPALATGGPVLADDVCWTDEKFIRPASAAGLAQALRRVTTIERMVRRARTGLERVARHPAVVGYAWRQWWDEPGEQPPFARGLVHRNGAEAREHTELLAEFNTRAELLRCAARPVSAALLSP
jgi:agarase